MIDIGRLRHRVILQRAERSTGDTGVTDLTWTTLGEAWATVSAIRSDERIEIGGGRGQTTHTVTMRYRSDLRIDDRIVYAGFVFEITGITHDETREKTIATCTERTDIR